jgi:hypothetical protein
VHFVFSVHEFERRLHLALYRFDCPAPQAIGDYMLDVLVEPDRRHLAEHVLGCADCAEDLHSLREFVAADPPLPKPSTVANWRRALATLLAPGPQVAPSLARGNTRGGSCEYRAGPIGVVLGTVAASRRGTVTVDGLLVDDTAASDAVADCEVKLIKPGQAVHTTRTDDLGNFAFDSVAVGVYTLEIRVADQVVAIEDLSLA